MKIGVTGNEADDGVELKVTDNGREPEGPASALDGASVGRSLRSRVEVERAAEKSSCTARRQSAVSSHQFC